MASPRVRRADNAIYRHVPLCCSRFVDFFCIYDYFSQLVFAERRFRSEAVTVCFKNIYRWRADIACGIYAFGILNCKTVCLVFAVCFVWNFNILCRKNSIQDD